MLKITKFSDKPCFLTGTEKDVVEVKFTDKSFTGSLSWAALLDIMKRKAVETQKDKNKAKHETGQTGSISNPKEEG